MKKLIRSVIIILVIGLLVGCNTTEPDTTTAPISRPGYWDDQILQNTPSIPTNGGDSIQVPTVSTLPSTISTKPSTASTTKPSTKPSTLPSTLPPQPPVTNPSSGGGKLHFTQYGRFSGKYIEDGKDKWVQGVAALYVTNVSDEYLEYAVINCDVNGKQAVFVVTGLKPGTSAWVLEKNQLVIEEADINDVTMTHLSDQTTFQDDNSDASSDVIVKLESGYLTAYNNTGKDIKSVYVYYKQQFSVNGDFQNGVFLGGITYRVLLGDIANGQTAKAIAGHCAPTGCEVVRVDWS